MDCNFWKRQIRENSKETIKKSIFIDIGGKMKKLMKAVLFGAVMLEAVSLTSAEFRIDLQVDKDQRGRTAATAASPAPG